MDWQINFVKPLVIGGIMVSVMQAVMTTVQLVVVAWMESLVQLVAHKRVMQYDSESIQAETELESTVQTEAVVWQASVQTEAVVWQASGRLRWLCGRHRCRLRRLCGRHR